MLNYIIRTLFFVYITVFSMSLLAKTVEKISTLAEQTQVAITIYNENLALIKDQRKVTLDKGFNQLAFRGISAKMRPETAMLRSLDNVKGIHVIEQNFDYDLLTPNKLLEKYQGRMIQVVSINPATGVETIEAAKVLSTHQGVVLDINGRIETNHSGRYVFDNIPKNLRDKPTLVTQLTSSSARPQRLELSYLSSGLSWKADYVVELNANDSQLDLLGWVTLNNQSGTGYHQAKLQLVAGDVNQVATHINKQMRRQERGMSVLADSMSMTEENLFEYHLYSLKRRTNILNKQTKQVALLSANTVPVSKEFILQGASYYYNRRHSDVQKKLKVAVFMVFNNNQQAGLGLPIPKGIVRVYKKDNKGNAQFIGEDHIDHTAKNDTIRLKLGNAFDISGYKKQTLFHKVKHLLPGRNAFESEFEITLKNAKSNAVTVTVREPIPADWQMLTENYAHKKVAANVAEWKINIPEESSKTLKYRVLVKY